MENRKLFKKFYLVDNNAYYYAVIGGDAYFGVSSLYHYKTVSPVFKIVKDHLEEQYFQSVKIHPSIGKYLVEFADGSDEDTLEMYRTTVRDKAISDIAGQETELLLHASGFEERKEITTMFTKSYSGAYDMFDEKLCGWENLGIQDLMSRGWTFLSFEFAGQATRNIWLGRKHEDLIHIVRIKLFGSPKNNEMVDYQRVLMTRRIAQEYLEKIAEQAQEENHD